MIRFINLKNQITGVALDEQDTTFAFYDTVQDRFIDLAGSQTFDSIDELTEYYKLDKVKIFNLERLKGLIPENYFE
jgi:hypothetical protein